MVEAWKIVVTIFCLIGSALFSGLTLGLMSLDLCDLQILMESGSEDEKKYAARIYPVRKTGNWLLVTLLSGNAMVNSALSIVSAEIFNGLVGFAVSTLSILYLGEILPQSICHRHGLIIGYYTTWLVYIFMALLSPLAWPTAKVLDYFLGKEGMAKYNKAELKSLVRLHGTIPDDGGHRDSFETSNSKGGLTQDELTILGSAIDFSQKTVNKVMTHRDKVFMLEISQKLDFSMLTVIFQTGHSRIPVFQDSRDNIVGAVFAKDLILLDPDDEIPIQIIMSVFGRNLLRCYDDTTLGVLINLFKSGGGHMAIVERIDNSKPEEGSFKEMVGIVTLEDLIEELIGSEIVDEHDVYHNNEKPTKVPRGRKIEPGVLKLFDSSLRHRDGLPKNEASAISAFLQQNFPELFGEDVILPAALRKSLMIATVEERQDDEKQPRHVLYERDVPSSCSILLLQGHVRIEVGQDNFVSEAGPWSLLGRAALTDDDFVPDFTAEVVGFPARYLILERALYGSCKELSKAVREGHGTFNEHALEALVQAKDPQPTLDDLKSGRFVLTAGGFTSADQVRVTYSGEAPTVVAIIPEEALEDVAKGVEDAREKAGTTKGADHVTVDVDDETEKP